MMLTRMTRIWVASGCAAIALAMSPSVATATIAADSALWEFSWEGDVLPENADPAWSNNWSGIGLGDFTLMSDQYSDSFARFDDSAYASGIEWEGSGVALDPKTNDGAAFEMRIRMPEGTVFWDIGFTDDPGDGNQSRFSRSVITPSKHTVRMLPLGAEPAVESKLNNDDFTVIRLVTDDTKMDLFQDGVLLYEYAGPFLANDQRTDAFLRMFSGSTSADCTIDFDYIRWTDGNPIPEPATLGLLTVGGLLAFARRRRR